MTTDSTPTPAEPLTAEALRKALTRAYGLGQTYWQQADSEYTSEHKKAAATADKFAALLGETLAALATPAAAAEIAQPAVPEPLTQLGALAAVIEAVRQRHWMHWAADENEAVSRVVRELAKHAVAARATQAQPATHAEVLTDEPLTDRELQTLRNLGNEAERAADEIVSLRAALATQAAQQPKDLGVSPDGAGLSAPLRSAAIPDAACGGWVRMEDAAPPPDTDCVVWARYSPGPGHFSIDRWEMQREDPIGMGGPTIETGHGWNDNFESDVIYWMALAPVPDADYDPRNPEGAAC